jgi:hypothetical protein
MLLPLICFFAFFGNIDYVQIFGEDYQKALNYCAKNKKEIAEKAKQYNLPSNELTAIIFPELIRYSSFQDFFETKALEIAYTNKGKEYADFSIGQFQMKPSFVEKLEVTIETDEVLKHSFSSIINYPEVDAQKKRQIRLERLKKKTWQIEYLCCFYAIVTKKFEKELEGLTLKRRIKCLATAYNYGFNKSWEDIIKWSTKACYPYGAKYPENQQYIYANVAWDFCSTIKS